MTGDGGRSFEERTMAREEMLARTFIESADTMVDDFDLVDVTQMMVERCVELFDVSAAGLLLAEQSGSLRVLASSSDQVRVLELFEVRAKVPASTVATRASRWPT